ncbi:Plectin [Acipenser ruthenus]|uniref:Plectin n=1 Tax=Acipenser ruthenus TaxID=7906 RepID=A0A444TY87_ACIRT|nr:Plectin [Acipenser ruthenus]
MTGELSPMGGKGTMTVHAVWIAPVQDACILGLDFLRRIGGQLNLWEGVLRILAEPFITLASLETPPLSPKVPQKHGPPSIIVHHFDKQLLLSEVHRFNKQLLVSEVHRFNKQLLLSEVHHFDKQLLLSKVYRFNKQLLLSEVHRFNKQLLLSELLLSEVHRFNKQLLLSEVHRFNKQLLLSEVHRFNKQLLLSEVHRFNKQLLLSEVHRFNKQLLLSEVHRFNKQLLLSEVHRFNKQLLLSEVHRFNKQLLLSEVHRFNKQLLLSEVHRFNKQLLLSEVHRFNKQLLLSEVHRFNKQLLLSEVHRFNKQLLLSEVHRFNKQLLLSEVHRFNKQLLLSEVHRFNKQLLLSEVHRFNKQLLLSEVHRFNKQLLLSEVHRFNKQLLLSEVHRFNKQLLLSEVHRFNKQLLLSEVHRFNKQLLLSEVHRFNKQLLLSEVHRFNKQLLLSEVDSQALTKPREKGRMRFHKLQNVQMALDFLKHRQVKLVNIRNDDIADGNPKLTLGLIWTIILHFQISDIQVCGQSDDMTAKEKLLLWSQRMVEGYQGLRCDNFTTSWRDGKLFNAVIHKHRPMLIDMKRVYRQTNQENLEQAFTVADRELGVTRLLDPEDVDVSNPDEKSIITYVSSLYDAMPRVPDVQDGVKANELELRWQEYYELVTLLLQWIRHQVIVLEERKFPSSYEEIEKVIKSGKLQILWRQFLRFKETELPAKEADKNRSKLVYKSFEGAVQSGQVKVPPGYHPIDVEKEWGRLHVAILERERLLRTEFERLERLQRIVSKIQMESGVCEEQLNQVDSLLQMDIRMLNAGKVPQNSGETEKELDKADGMIRLLFNDVQALKDGRHPQAEQMYRRVYHLHERLVALRTDYNLRLKAGASQSSITMTQQSMTQHSSRQRSELDDVTLHYVQDLQGWVEENQRRIDGAEWGVDLPSVESQLGSHRGLHQSIEDFRSKIERARADENQLSPISKGSYREYLGKLDLHYAKLLNSSKSRLRHLDNLHGFVSSATKELMWLNDKEEEEVNYDWSDRNTNMSAKKDNYSGLMRELEQKERKINSTQATGEQLLKEGNPGRKTVEAFMAALQTQWSWILQLCCCIEAHLKENTAYFQFFSDVKESEEYLKKMQESMKKKYSCDRTVTVTRLEDLLQDAMDEKEQLNEYKGQLAGLNKRAKTIVQLKPRNAANPLKSKLPLQAVCDFKQMEITVHKGDECVLLNNSQPYKWKVLNASGNEAVVPSVCFLIPPANKEALDAVSSLDSSHQKLVTMWHHLHIDMKSMLSWQYLIRDIQQIKSWNITMFKTMKPEEYTLILRNLELHYQDFMRDSQDSQLFGADDRMQIESDYSRTSQYYDRLLRTLEKGEHDESVCKSFITQMKDIRLQLEGCESHTIHKIHSPLDKDPLKDCFQRIAEQKQIQVELEGIKKNLNKVTEKTEAVLASPEQSVSAPVLRSELDVTLQKMDQVYSLSTVYLDKLKTIDLVIRSTQEAEELVKKYEDRLREVNNVPADAKELETYRTQLKKTRSEAEGRQPVFDGLEAELTSASAVSERLSRVHSERDLDLDRYRLCVSSLLERWQGIFTQLDLRQRELEQLGRQLRYYRESYDWLITWITDAKQRQENIQAVSISNSKTLKEQLTQEKRLLEEIEKNKDKVDECQKYAKGYIDTIKDYELQLVTYKAMVEPLASPVKKTKVESAADNIIQEYVTLRTRYSELTTLTSQYIKFITETQRRLEQDEKAAVKLKEEEMRKMAEMQAELDKQKQLAEAHAKAIAKAEKEAQELKLKMQEEVTRREAVAVDAEQQKQNIQQELQQLKNNSVTEIKSKTQQVEEALSSRTRIEEEIRLVRIQLETTVKQKSNAESELQQLRQRAEEAERQRKAAQEEAEKLLKQVKEESQKKRQAEEELKKKVEAEKEAARQKQKAMEDLEKLKMQAEEAERRMKQAEIEKDRQFKVAQEVAQKSAAAELQSKRMSFAEKTAQLEQSLKQEHVTVTYLQEEAERLKRQQEEADNAREEAEKELEKWRQKANEALRLRLQAEEIAHKKSLAQEDAEKQKEEAEREAKKRAKAEEAALRQKEMAEHELEKQRQIAEGTAQQKLSAEQELIRLRAEFEHGEQQRSLLEEELYRLKNEVNEAVQQRKLLEDELTKVRAEMEILLQSKSKAEKETMSNSEKSKQLLEAEAAKMRELAEEAMKLRSISEESKKQRQLAEEEAARQRAEAERILKEKLAAINEATRLKTEAEIALKEKEAENERLRRQAEDEAYQRKILEEQASQHKQDIEEKIHLLKKSSESELERQKAIVDETLKQRRIVEEEIRILKISFEKASSGKLDLELALNKLKNIADETQHSKEQAEKEAEKQRQLALEEENRRKEAEEKVKKIAAAEEEAARQHKAALGEVERLKKKAEEARKQKELAEKEAEKQIQLAQQAAEKRIAAEEKAHIVLVQQKEQELMQTRMQEQSILDKLKEDAEKAKKMAEEAEKAKQKAQQEAARFRQQAEEAERQKQAAEVEATNQAEAQHNAEQRRKEAEFEAAKRAQTEAAALKQKELADAEMEKHKKLAEQTVKQKAQVEKELTKVKLQLEETDTQKGLLDEELHRLKDEVTDAVRQKAQVEEELFKVRIQMEELIKLKIRIENENQMLMKKDKDSTQQFLQEEAENMKKLAEEAARLSVAAQEAARLRQIAESDLAQQRALAEKMLKEKMQAIQEASRLKAEAEMLQRQKDLAQEQAQKLLEDKQQMQQRLEEETEGFQKTLEAERRRQLEITAEAEKLKLKVSQLSDAQSRAVEEAKKFKRQADEISSRLHETELFNKQKFAVVEKLEMAVAQQEQIKQETHILQKTFITEKEMLIKKEKFIEEEKSKLEKQFEEEMKKAKALKDEQERQRKQMEEEKKKLQSTMDAALKKQQDAEEEVRSKQNELQELEKKRLEQEKLLAEENRKLREKLQQLQSVNGGDAVDSLGSPKQNGEAGPAFDGIREKVPASRLLAVGILNIKLMDKLKKGQTTVEELAKTENLKNYLQGKNSIGGVLLKPNQKMSLYQALKNKIITPGTAMILLEAQAASGYIIDPIKNKKLSVDEAVKEGLIGPELHNSMLSAERAVTGYKDPYTGNKISLFEAMKKGLIIKEHGIRLLEAQIATGGIIDPVNSHRVPIETAYKLGFFDAEMNKILSDPSDDTKGFFDPNTQENLTYLQLMERCVTDPETGLCLLPITEKAAKSEQTYTDEETKDVFRKATVSVPFGRFKGKTVTIWEIINSEYFTEEQRRDLIRQYKTGKITVEKIIKIIVTVVEEGEKKKQVAFEGLRTSVPANELLESKIIDKDLYNQLHQGKKSIKDVSELEPVKKCLRGTNSIAGVVIESTKEKLPIYQAMKKDFLRQGPGLALLEAQAATGYIINPVTNEKLTVDEAVKARLVGPELHDKLLSAERAMPSWQPEVSLTRSKAIVFQWILPASVDIFVTIWEIINSEYFTEEQRRDLIRQYKTGKITVEKIIKIIVTVVEEGEKKKQVAFEGLRTSVPANELLESKIIDKDLYNQLHQGKKSIKDVSELEPVKKCLRGTNSIAGVVIESTKEKLPIYQAMKKDFLRQGPGLALLEAQAATGYIINPVTNEKLTVDEAVKARLVGPELHDKLLSAERAVTGFKDPYTGSTVSLFQAMQKALIHKDQGIRLLDAQLATGGVIDPVKSHRVPVDIACKRGYLDDEMNKILSNPTDDTKGFFDPNTQENVTYLQLMKRCVMDKDTGLCLLPLSEKAIKAKEEQTRSDIQTKEALNQATVEVQSGPFKGKRVTIWEIINSEYLTEEQRIELIRQYRTGKMTMENIIKLVITIIDETETKKQQQVSFNGLRAQVPASSLFDSNIIDKATYDQLQQGKKTPKEVSEIDSVKKYLQGTNSIAGIYVEPTKEKLTIYQAMNKHYIRPSTAVGLLEAQAATGFIIDPIKNQKLTVHDAVKAGIVGPELHEKLLTAEKAVTGYKDPYTRNKISVFQAMQKDLVLKEQAIRLLEAQIATGGIIDPVNSHRVPIEVAYKRGYFDQEINKMLSHPSDDTKGFVDPNTNDKLTYQQLKEGCIRDPDTGLCFILLKKTEAPSVVEKTFMYTEEQTMNEFDKTQVEIPLDSHAGKSMSLWDVMNSDLIPEEERIKLLEEYRSGSITKERMVIIIIEIIEQREIIRHEQSISCDVIRRKITIEELYSARIIDLETYNLLKQGKKTIREIMETEIVKRYLFGTGSIAGFLASNEKVSIYQAMKRGLIKPEVAFGLLEAQAATGFMIDPVKDEMLTVDEAVRKNVVGPEIHDKLLSAERAVTGYRDPYSGKTISLFQAMKKDLISEEYALKLLEAQFATGGIMDPEYNFHLPTDVALQRGYMNKETNEKISDPSGDIKGYLDPVTEEKLSYAQLLKRCKIDMGTGLRLLSLSDRRLTFKGLRKQITMEELVRSEIIDQKTVQQLQEGLTTVEEVSRKLQNYLEGTSCIAGVFVESTKDRLSVYQAMKKNMIRPGTAFELLEAQAATGYVIDPIKNQKLTVNEAVLLGIVGPEFKDKLLSAERAVTGYKDPYSGKIISLFQAMKKGLILKDHGIRLIEAQIATGGIIDPEESHRLPVEVAYKRGLFDEEMNKILSDPSDDTKGFFDPNTEENLTYLQLMERCFTDPETGLVLLFLKEKKRERKTSSMSSVRKRRVVIVDPDTGKEMSVYEAYRKGLIDHQTYLELSEQECEWEEITISSSDGVVKSIIIDRRSGRQYDIDDALSRGLINQSSLDQYRSGSLSITEFADMLSGNMSGFRSRSSSIGSSSSYPMSPLPSISTPATTWSDPTEETGPVAGILDTDTLEKVSITEAIHRNLVDNITGQRLLEAQSCTGGIIDPNTGEKFPVADAMNKGLVDKIMVDRINLAQKAYHGFEDPRTKTKMSAAQALKKGWLYYEAGQRFLEVQYLTGGLIEPDVAGRVQLDEAIRKGTLDARTAQKLRDVSAYSKYLTCPKTKLKISYKDAMDRSMVEEGSGLRLLEASSESSKGLYSPYNASASGSASGSRSGSRTGSRTGSRRGSFDATGTPFSTSFSSSSYSSSSYGRRYDTGPLSGLSLDKLAQGHY